MFHKLCYDVEELSGDWLDREACNSQSEHEAVSNNQSQPGYVCEPMGIMFNI